MLSFWLGSVTALLVGVGIGMGGGPAQADYDTVSDQRAELRKHVRQLERERDQLRGKTADLKTRAELAEERAKKLSARGDVPDFVGADVGDAEGNDVVSQYGWRIKTSRQISDRTPGTVLAQSPRPGSTLKSGRAISLTVAKEAPPKPKQWVTIETLQGASSTKTPEFRVPPDMKARLLYSMPQDGNNAITLFRKPNEYVDLVLNEIGPQQGSTRLYERGTFYLDVTGAYSIQVQVFKRP